jgi:two-component system, NarL family, sensor kinase
MPDAAYNPERESNCAAGCDRVGDQDLDRFREQRQRRSMRMVSVARLGVVALMGMALDVGVTPDWTGQLALLIGYAMVAIGAAVAAFVGLPWWDNTPRVQFVFTIIDVAAVLGYKLMSPDGAYVPLLVMTLLPIMVVLDMSSRRAAVALIVMTVAFAIAIYGDAKLVPVLGWGRPTLVFIMFVFVSCIAWFAVYTHERHINVIARLSATREALLVDTMTAAERQQRTVSEFIHDGPLQSVLMARQDIVAVLKTHPDEKLERALAGLLDATEQMREATFELHPAVLAGAGLTRAVKQLAVATGARSGIDISADVDCPRADPADPVVFAAVRELLANVVRHSRATEATLELKVVDGGYRLDVVDNGIGMSAETATQRLAEGHIGLASQRARVEAAGGTLRILDTPVGTHVVVTVPLGQ